MKSNEAQREKMATSHILPKGYVKSALHNGVGRHVCQLQRITIKFCKSFGNSRGVREFIEQDLLDFAKSNPGIVVYVKPRRHRPPYLDAEYLHGQRNSISCHNFKREEIIKWIEYLKTSSGHPIERLLDMQHSNVPSIQGTWTPFTNFPTNWNVTSFPDEESSVFHSKEKSATEILLEMMKNNPNVFVANENTEKIA
uniref:Large ribosomal subunit protein mL43 n=1 Tax=Strigamia maritima TaxID=126957 RepID=T1IQI2_STRMM